MLLPLRSCKSCGRLTTMTWCRTACWRAEDAPYDDDDDQFDEQEEAA